MGRLPAVILKSLEKIVSNITNDWQAPASHLNWFN
jgi:hypothetical protein